MPRKKKPKITPDQFMKMIEFKTTSMPYSIAELIYMDFSSFYFGPNAERKTLEYFQALYKEMNL